MSLDGFFGDEEERRYVTIAISSRDFLQDVDLALAQCFLTEMLGDVMGYLRRDMLLSLMDFANHLHQLLPGHALQHVSACPGFESALDLDISFEGGQHNDACIRKLGSDDDGGIDAADIRKPEIHQRDIRPVLSK